MITGLRSAIVCDRVEQDGNGGADYLGIWGETVTAASRPGLADVWLALQVDVDREATSGRIHVKAADYDQSFPFEIPAGYGIAAMAFPLFVPVRREGHLTVSVIEDGRKAKPMTARWRLGFAENAQEVGPEAGVEAVQIGVEMAQMLVKSFGSKRPLH